MPRRLDLGIASYQNPDKLDQTLHALRRTCRTDWRCLVADNLSSDVKVRQVIDQHASEEPRILARFLSANTGYAGAVNEILNWAETPYVAYCDNDAVPVTEGWDEALARYFDQFHELAMVFPQGGAYPIHRDHYTEILWGVGYCWMTKTGIAKSLLFDETLGHQEEVDFQIRLRMAGWKIATTNVTVEHHATATNDPKSQERINRGVENWVNKWVRYFCGVGFNYHSPNVIRFEDWPPMALYLEEYWLRELGSINLEPEQVFHNGRVLDLCKVPRYPHLYRHRII